MRLERRLPEKAGKVLNPKSSTVPKSARILNTEENAPAIPFTREILAAGVARTVGGAPRVRPKRPRESLEPPSACSRDPRSSRPPPSKIGHRKINSGPRPPFRRHESG